MPLPSLVLLAAAVTASPPAPAAARVHALVLNGGGEPDANFASHLAHVRAIVDLLAKAGVSGDRVTVLASDGDAPAPDLNVGDDRPDGFWLIEPTRLGERLAPPPKTVDSRVPGVRLAPATRAGVQRAFTDLGHRLRAGDTLLLYVTDHGEEQKGDPLGNRIVLWGRNESLSVRQLRALIATLPRGVRVVSLMSQCFSGAFALLGGELPDRDVCGYFSSTADRPAYGCYPQSSADDQIGHSFDFFRALTEAGGAFPRAHDRVLIVDRTPDVPLRSSDVLAADALARAAGPGADVAAYADRLLAEAFRDRARFEPELRLLDGIGAAFGMTSPRTLAGIEDARKRLADGLEQVRTTGRAWDEVAGDLAEANLQRFVDANPAWQRRLLVARRPMREPDRAALLGDLLAELVPSSRAEAERWSRLEAVSERAARADEASYRLEVRLAALLRMRAVLQDVAARTLFGRGDREARASSSAFDRLRSCEALTLPLPAPSVAREAPAEAYPSFEEEMKAAQEALPGWMGIRFQDAPPALAARLRLLRGASQIVNVFPDSPAQASGLDVGDVVLGPPGHPFQERNEVRTWTMLAAIGQPAPLEILRDGKRRTVTLVPGPRPLKWPELPGPPKLGTAAPAVRGDAFRGKLPAALAGGGEHLLLFWATWCAPCKASLPEVMAFSAERHVPVIAITDEPATTLRAFFAKWPSAKAFPEIVVSDEARRTFAAYGVSGTPTFVLVGGDGAVRGYRTGYSPADGLPVPGWRWTR